MQEQEIDWPQPLWRRWPALYCGYQVLFPELQRRKIAAAQAKAARKRGAMFAAHLGNTMGGILIDGEVNVQAQ